MSHPVKTWASLVVAGAFIALLVSCGGSNPSAPDLRSAPPQGKEGRSDATNPEGPVPSKLEADISMSSVKGTGPKPKLRYPQKPPRHVVSRVLKVGSGPAVTPGEELVARYVGGNPRTKLVQDFWSERDPYRFRLGDNTLGRAWVIGMKGMKLGGRRELIVPSRLAYGNGMMVYVIELLGMEKRKPKSEG